MSAIPSEAVLAQLKWRYATKKFDPAKKITPAVWQTLEHSLVLAPSSFGLQLWKFIVVTDPAVRAKLKPASWNQQQVIDASHLVVFAVKKGVGPADADKLIDRTAQVRGVPVQALEAYKGMMYGYLSRPADQIDPWATKQLYIALGFFLQTAALLGIDACPMEGIEPEKYDDILGLTAKGYGSVVVAAAGYRADDCELAKLPKVRYAPSEVIEHV